MTAFESYLRLNSYKIVDMSHQIFTLTVHEPNGQTIVLEEDNEFNEILGQKLIDRPTLLTGFFDLCSRDEDACKYTYDQIPLHYW